MYSCMPAKVEVRMSSDGRLLMVVHFVEDSNFWINSNGSISYVPRKTEVELIKETLQAVDNYNIEKMFKRNLRKGD
jgi:hypothetical protein